MPSAHRAGFLLVALVALAAAGCGGTAKPKKAKAAKPVVPAEVDAAAAVPVDDDRITVAPPTGWKREPRSKDYLARYVPGGGKTYPSVTVLGGDPPAGITAVGADEHAAFVAAVADRLAEQFTGADGKSSLLRKPAAVELGEHRAVVWSAPGTAKVDGISKPIERHCVAVVVAGRMYTVEARAPKGKLDDAGRAAAHGVAAGIAVPEAAEPEPEATAPAEPAPEAPAAGDQPEPATDSAQAEPAPAEPATAAE